VLAIVASLSGAVHQMSAVDGNLLGIVLAIVASLSGALGNLIIRLSWRRETYRKTTR